jgi:indolepyruvate ferredoxin oxidoreductase
VDFVRQMPSGEMAEAVARNLYKLMAYKDEYEVARLHLDEFERARLHAEFGDAKVYFMLHPPLLRALGMKRKLKLGSWFVPFFRMLRGMRRLRGTKLDLFGLPEVRRVERRLIGHYRATMTQALEAMTPANAATVLELAELPDEIRGYEDIKLRSVKKYEMRSARLRKRLQERAVSTTEVA